MEDALEIYTLYDHPADFPNSYVLKCDKIVGGKVIRENWFYESDLIGKCFAYMRKLNKIAMYPSRFDDPIILMTFI
jgi:hypothetical protein